MLPKAENAPPTYPFAPAPSSNSAIAWYVVLPLVPVTPGPIADQPPVGLHRANPFATVARLPMRLNSPPTYSTRWFPSRTDPIAVTLPANQSFFGPPT